MLSNEIIVVEYRLIKLEVHTKEVIKTCRLYYKKSQSGYHNLVLKSFIIILLRLLYVYKIIPINFILQDFF